MYDWLVKVSQDLMTDLKLNVLLTGDMYVGDVNTALAARRKERNELGTALGGLQFAIAQGMLPASELMPQNVCGVTSTMFCQVLLDTTTAPAYRYAFDKRKSEPGYFTNLVFLAGALKGRPPKYFVLRVDCTGHSYVVLITPNPDEGYILQSNASESLKQYTLTEWVNGEKAKKPISVREHLDLLFALEKEKEISKAPSPTRTRFLKTYGIDDKDDPSFKPFKAGNLEVLFRELKESTVRDNLVSLYKRAGSAVPDALKKVG